MTAIPYSLFHGLFLAAVALGTAEAMHLALTAGESISGFDRLMASLYVISPFALLGICIATLAAALTEVWNRTRQVTPTSHRNHRRLPDIIAAFLVTMIFTVGIFLLARGLFSLTTDRLVVSGILAIATPVLVVSSLYIWAILRVQIARLEDRTGRAFTYSAAGIAISGAIAIPIIAIAGNEALANFLGEWTALYIACYPLLTIVFATALHHWSPIELGIRSVRRWLLACTVIGAAGTIDLIHSLDKSPAVKHALLNNSLVFQPIIVTAQPLFDADGDGYAGLLGGGDCNDSDSSISPGAIEIPRNGIDDDCFDGDSPGDARPTVILPMTPKPAASRGLIERPNIILITLDTVRADHLGYQGYTRDTSPKIDEHASRGLRFRWAFAQGPQTRLSVPSMFSGKYYSEMARTPDVWARVHDSNLLLAERLTSAGYLTAGIPSHRFFLPIYGLNQGFEHWDLSIIEKYQKKIPFRVTGNQVSDKALAWLRQQDPDGRPFFLWLHYFDPHFAYKKHEGIDFGDTPLDRYDGEIKFTDIQVGRLLDWLGTSQHGAKTYVIIHSDHGEGFGMHGYQYHGQQLFNDQVHVPLVITGPGLKSRQLDTPVALLDVVPTVLDLAGISIPADLSGVSLIPYGTDTVPPEHGPVFIEMLKDATHSDRRAIVDWPFKLQYGITFDEYTLYDLIQDPEEQRNLITQRPKVFARLQRALRRWMSQEVKPVKPTIKDPVPKVDTQP